MTKLETKLAEVVRALRPKTPNAPMMTIYDVSRTYHAKTYQWMETSNAMAALCSELNPGFKVDEWRAYIDRPEPASHLVVEDRAEYASSIRKGRK